MLVEPRECWVEPAVASEFPELRLVALRAPARPEKRSPPELKERLKHLSNRTRGAQAIALRRQAVPHAYRVFFRHVGLDPDQHHTPVEAAMIERMRAGRFASHGTLADAATVALVETGVPVWALDAVTLAGEGDIGIRTAQPGETLGRAGMEVPHGRLAVVDALGPVAILFGALAAEHAATPASTLVVLFAVQVKGVPSVHVGEALEQVAEWIVPD